MDSNHLQKQVVAEQKRKVEAYDYRRAGYGHSTGGIVPDYQGFCPPAVNFFGDRPDCQHFPDHYIHSGADADVCAEDTACFYWHDAAGRLDAGEPDKLHNGFME